MKFDVVIYHQLLGMEPTKPDFNRLVIEKSGVVRSVVKVICLLNMRYPQLSIIVKGYGKIDSIELEYIM